MFLVPWLWSVLDISNHSCCVVFYNSFTVTTRNGENRVSTRGVVSVRLSQQQQLKSSSSMESAYDRFNSYDFEGNARFQEGLRNIQAGSRATENILKLKIFYYDRFVEPVDLEGFRQWSLCLGSKESLPDCVESRNLEAINHDTKPMEQSDCEQVLFDSADSCQSERSDSLSFEEVFRLIQEGEEVPGIQTLDITPCQQTPTVSQMSRRLKPWERDDTSTISVSPNE